MKLYHLMLDLLYPPFCAACGELLPIGREFSQTSMQSSSKVLCPTCLEKWRQAKETRCFVCHRKQCECSCTPRSLLKLKAKCAHIAAYRTAEDTAGRLLMAVKDENYTLLYDFLAEELAERLNHLPMPKNCLITFLPRSRRRAADAGVDQAKELARRLSAISGFPMLSLFDRKQGGVQKELSAEERLVHARAAYKLKENHPSLDGRTVVLVDDIFTTGASMLAAAELLTADGADRLICLTIAKTCAEQKKLK